MKRIPVSFEYDREMDAAYLSLARGKVASSEEVKPGLIVDFDCRDRVVGVEILRFSRRFMAKTSNGASRKRKVAV
jgi:uncharacterized protein YuzE